MDFCILGLLVLMPRSAYGLRQAFAQGMGLFYSASLGSVQKTLQKLVSAGLVCLQAEESGGRRTKCWAITPAGQAWFFAELTGPLPQSRLEETILARYFFLGLLDAPGRCQVLQGILAAIESVLATLEAQDRQLTTLEVPEPWQQVARYQTGTLAYGIHAHRAALAWFAEALTREGFQGTSR